MSEASINNSHDLFTRQSLTHLPTACSLIEQYLPPDVVEKLDLSTIALQESSFVDTELQASLSDLLFEVSLRGGGHVLVGILFEHKSYPDPYIALQLLRYSLNIWERQRREEQPLTAIIPIVLYHGRSKWDAPTTMRQLIAASGALSGYVPDSETCLIDLSRIPDEQLLGSLRLQIMLRILKHVFDPQLASQIEQVMPLVKAVIREENSQQLLKTLLRYLCFGTERLKYSEIERIVHKTLSTDTEMPTIADELRAEGRVEGRVQGLQLAIWKLIERRFPEAGSNLFSRVDALNSVETLTDVLGHAAVCDSPLELVEYLKSL